MHDHKNGHNSWMMWLMMLPCALILIFTLVGSGKILSGGGWKWLTGIGFMVGIHALIMKFMRKHDKNKTDKMKEKD
ncbi:MAG: hypothetical protein Q7S18_00880 [bacterium]|nr:hypothetical protein [bacterium]